MASTALTLPATCGELPVKSIVTVGRRALPRLTVMVTAIRTGCGLMPSGVYHLELPTTIPDRTVDAPYVLL